MPRPMVFLKIGWMARYKGAIADPIQAQHRFVQENKSGAEDRNFLPQDGRCYGYAPMHRTLHLSEHFSNVSEDAEYVDGVDVVFIARKRKGGVYVVGWYENARLYATLQKSRGRYWLAEAPASNCRVLEPRERVITIPVNTASGPRSPAVWYATRERELKNRVRQLMAGHYRPKPGRLVPSAKPEIDVARKAEIERKAVEAVVKQYTSLGFDVIDRQSQNVGWDLDASRGDETYRLEIKGSAHPHIAPELTCNEYSASLKHVTTYRICIVTRALSGSPSINEVAYDAEIEDWVDSSGKRWQFVERTAAKVMPA